ncbi:MAG: hypothetical protein HC765_13175 [Brachymonas sp.]|nr:hypothetical protein [Brachymonas sp.]
MFGQQLADRLRLPKRAHERHHDFDVGQTHVTVLVMAGSHMHHAAHFFERMAQVCALLHLQALFIAPTDIAHRPWPAYVQAISYAPLSQVLPRCAALVSHPGIGTIAQAMRCGTRMLLTPYAFDHHDNAQRAVSLGIAHIVSPAAGSASLARRLKALLEDEQIASACQIIQAQMPQAEATRALIYELLHQPVD